MSKIMTLTKLKEKDDSTEDYVKNFNQSLKILEELNNDNINKRDKIYVLQADNEDLEQINRDIVLKYKEVVLKLEKEKLEKEKLEKENEQKKEEYKKNISKDTQLFQQFFLKYNNELSSDRKKSLDVIILKNKENRRKNLNL